MMTSKSSYVSEPTRQQSLATNHKICGANQLLTRSGDVLSSREWNANSLRTCTGLAFEPEDIHLTVARLHPPGIDLEFDPKILFLYQN